jgi:hypothetical protein
MQQNGIIIGSPKEWTESELPFSFPMKYPQKVGFFLTEANSQKEN